MRVLHIIPSAFSYFDDIRAAAFKMVEEEAEIGVDTEAFTLDYGPPKKSLKDAVAKKASTRTFQGQANIHQILASFEEFDVIHVHCPLLGAVGEILAYKKRFPGLPLVVTYHRRFTAPDLFGVFISWYTAWYQPKLFRAADAIVALSPHRLLANNPRVIDLTAKANGLECIPDVSAYKALYATLIN